MINNKINITFTIILVSIRIVILQQLRLFIAVIFWVIILVYLITKNKNHFISLLLILEIISLRRIYIIRFLSHYTSSIRMMFILITLRVGEAVLGLAILVKLVRWSSREFIMVGLN